MTDLIRGPRKTDQGYIASTWVQQMRSARNMSPKRGVAVFGRQVDAVLDRPDTRALVRHRAGDPDAILGWVVYVEGPGVPMIHFAYVRREARGHGYGAELLQRVGVTPSIAFVYTCRGPSTSRLLTKYRAASHLPLQEFLA